ncbi:MAG: Carboxyl-terminal protease [candidate division WS6 bacterium GW2011_GWE1_34_7]|uniref:Carboxyl-terminal protease n=1 Tax=candidate division WS6 bacterium GW2011_GWE1_34_7 TaxID=1619093 RepID=A0A0G0B347_9BACT|nr:MAG: Carboxyl-terminal protease [candidate division WS6 bacterium GW2011_GWE1_34_7]
MQENSNGARVFGLLMLTVVAFCVGVIFGRYITPSGTDLLSFNASKRVDFDLFWEVWGVLESKYVEKEVATEEEMVYGAIKGLVNSYGDPATVFLTPEETENFNDSNEGKLFQGIGAELGYEDGAIIIVTPLDGSPAKAAGIRPGDYILAVDDYELKGGENVYEIVQKIRGDAGTVVKLEILHKGEFEPVTLEITRGEITVPSMELSYIGERKDIALIDITRFTEASLQDWAAAWDDVVKDIQTKKVNKILIDLRSNPGGYFNAAVYAADDFLDSGKIISKQEDGDGKVQTFDAEEGGRLLGKKVVILVDGGSASASEIFAGALQQNGVATVIGEETYGKGTAQSVLDLRGGSSIHITVLKWLLPDGSWLNRDNPIKPDVIVENSAEDFVKGVDKQYNEAIILINK